jgi:hypothetical protein
MPSDALMQPRLIIGNPLGEARLAAASAAVRASAASLVSS